MLTALTLVFGFYALLVLTLCWGWAILDEKSKAPGNEIRKISVVVAFRNEEASLPALVSSLKDVRYPSDKVEFILVDDHSEDQSESMVRELVSDDARFTVLHSDMNSTGKKAALTYAISRSTGEIVAVTDADCLVPVNWLTAINAAFADDKLQMMAGAVRLSERNWFEKTQAMEFASLVAAAGATIGLGLPTMSNASNLAFRRSAFLQVNGFAGNELVSSGDDHFLMKKIAARWKGSVGFLYAREAVVTATAASTISQLISQRLRWAGKWTMAIDPTSMLALGVLMFHLSYLFLLVAWLLGAVTTTVFFSFVGIRLFVEVLFLLPVCRFLNTRWLWSSFLFLQFFYPVYVVSIGCLSQILTTRWKGREVTTGVWTGIS